MKAQDLKNSILQLAIQGKLVEQRAEEGTAKELLEKIAAEKKQLIQEGKIKKTKALPEITEDEIPFEIPVNWKWVRIENIIDYDLGGGTPSKQSPSYWNGNIPWMSVKDYANNPNGVEDTLEKITEEGLNKSSSNLIQAGNIIVCTRVGLGKIAVNNVDVAINQDLRALFLSKYIDKKYFIYYYSRINVVGKGTTVKGIKREELLKYVFPLPPLEEQKRIVAKIEELMPYVEKYDVAYSEVEELNKKFPEDMQKSILQYAIQGKLVEQRKEDGTAEELYQQIQEEKKKLIEEGKIKKTKALPVITEDEIPFDIPENWKWVRLLDLGITQTGNTPSKTKMEYFGDFMPFISPGDILNGSINYNNQGLSEQGKVVGRVSETNSILQVCIGGSIGKCAINSRDVSYNQQINAITPLVCNYLYVYYLMVSRFFLVNMTHKATGTATPIINKSSWESIVIPLPPLAEQKRIVEKIEELLPYTKQLVK